MFLLCLKLGLPKTADQSLYLKIFLFVLLEVLGPGRSLGEEGSLRDCSNGQAPSRRAVDCTLEGNDRVPLFQPPPGVSTARPICPGQYSLP